MGIGPYAVGETLLSRTTAECFRCPLHTRRRGGTLGKHRGQGVPLIFINSRMEDKMSDETKVTQEYGAEQIQVLEGLEAVRKRPGREKSPRTGWMKRCTGC